MLPDEAAHVFAVRSGFAAKARRVGRVLQRQQVAVQNLAAMNIRQRYLGRGNQKKIPFAGNLEEVGFELRQLSRRLERCPIDEIRRHDLEVSVLARVQIEHEVCQRARQSRAGAEKQRKSRARHLRGALEFQNTQGGPEIPVRARLEIERRRLSPRAHDHVVRFALADGDAGVGHVRQRHQDDQALLLDLIELDGELAYLLRALPVRLEDTARVLPLTLGPRHFVAGRILIALQTFELRNQPASPVFERRELLEIALHVPAAVLQAASDFFLVIAYV